MKKDNKINSGFVSGVITGVIICFVIFYIITQISGNQHQAEVAQCYATLKQTCEAVNSVANAANICSNILEKSNNLPDNYFTNITYLNCSELP